MDITLRLKKINGSTNFQNITLKISNPVEGDFFDMSGNYLGATKQSKKEIYILGRDFIQNPYSRNNLPKDFYDKKVSFNGKGNIINSKIGGQYGNIITVLSIETRSKLAGKVYNHYYTEAGYNLNELKYKTITDGDSGYAETKLGGVSNNSEYLKKGEADIQIVYGHIGLNLDTGYDIMSICSHEHNHLEDLIKYGGKYKHMFPETRAYTHQTLVDKNWKFISFRLKANLDKQGFAFSAMYKDDYKKAFGDRQQYVGFDPDENITKQILIL
ncbi:hypothetical protein KHA90_21615 [Flavobacterium psychroterrae]|uniref:Tox-MPTase2 domain-containing protein n=1 Tax=Flavobacterium psychroterrae TaxID=2133767 RepID=A0ABS5PIU9_9FLAO|nr:hypothetical protein [Flavobacterium psychroterrae]MBS7233616.1 hypothetical protein [Flavobacterium psychroterrae]